MASVDNVTARSFSQLTDAQQMSIASAQNMAFRRTAQEMVYPQQHNVGMGMIGTPMMSGPSGGVVTSMQYVSGPSAMVDQRKTSMTYINAGTPATQTRSRGMSGASIGGASIGGATGGYMYTGGATTGKTTYSTTTGPAHYSNYQYSSGGMQQSNTGRFMENVAMRTAGASGTVSSTLTPTAAGMLSGGGANTATSYQTTTSSPMNIGGSTTTYTTSGGMMAGGMMAGGMTSTAQRGVTSNMQLTGREVVIAVNTYTDESRTMIVGERVTEQEVRVPKKIVREEIIERTYVVPEKIVHEETIEEVVKIRQKIIEVQKPIIQEKIVEVPEIEEVYNIIEVPQVIKQEKIREVPKIEYKERIIEVPKPVYVEKIVEIPDIQTREVPVEKVVEVPKYLEEVVTKEIPVPQYIEKPYPEYVEIKEDRDITRMIPVPVEAIINVDLQIPQIRRHYKAVEVPLYVPKFIEVPIPMDLMEPQAYSAAESYAQQVASLATYQQSSHFAGGFLCEFERLGGVLKNVDSQTLVSGNVNDITTLWQQAFASGNLQIENAHLLTASGLSASKYIDVNNIITSSGVIPTATATATTATGVTGTSTTTTTTTERVIKTGGNVVTTGISGVSVPSKIFGGLATGTTGGVSTISVSSRSIGGVTAVPTGIVTGISGVASLAEAAGLTNAALFTTGQGKTTTTTEETTTTNVNGVVETASMKAVVERDSNGNVIVKEFVTSGTGVEGVPAIASVTGGLSAIASVTGGLPAITSAAEADVQTVKVTASPASDVSDTDDSEDCEKEKEKETAAAVATTVVAAKEGEKEAVVAAKAASGEAAAAPAITSA